MSNIKNVVIFGATGNTGLCSVQAALAHGYNVTAFIRDPSKLPADLHNQVRIVVGDVTKASDVETAVDGQDAAIVCLGTRNSLDATTVMSEGTRIILESMVKFNVRRISVCISSFLFWERSKVPEKYHALTIDHEKMLNIVKAADCDWIAVLPPQITEKPGNGSPTIAHDKGPGRFISKYDLGMFLVTCLTKPEHFRNVCGICDSQ